MHFGYGIGFSQEASNCVVGFDAFIYNGERCAPGAVVLIHKDDIAQLLDQNFIVPPRGGDGGTVGGRVRACA